MSAPELDSAVRWVSRSNKLYVGAGILALFATVGALYFGAKEANLRESMALSQRKDADARIAEANALAKSALADTARALADLEASKMKIREMELAQAKLDAKAEATRGKVATLEERAEPRRISEASRNAIAALLKPFSGQEVRVHLYSGEAEAGEFQAQVMETLRLAGLVPHSARVVAGTGRGFGIAIHGKTLASALASSIRHAFEAEGFRMGVVSAPSEVADGEFFIIVGAKK